MFSPYLRCQECLQIEHLAVFVLIPFSNHDLNSSNSNQSLLNDVNHLDTVDLLCNYLFKFTACYEGQITKL